MSRGAVTAPSRPRISRRRWACAAWIPDFVPFRKKRFSPLFLKLGITGSSVTYNVTRYNLCKPHTVALQPRGIAASDWKGLLGYYTAFVESSWISMNLLRNSMGLAIPGTGACGFPAPDTTTEP